MEASRGVSTEGPSMWRHEQACSEFSVFEILDRDAEQTCICIVQPGRDKRAGEEIDFVFTQNWPNVAEGTNVVETGFRENCDVWVERKRLIESDT